MRRLMILTLLVTTAPTVAHALPMYAQRSGRTCGNCHISPTYEDPKGWLNPELSKRKCNMSCMTCHVNPGGGGLRNTAGRYYGQSTLSIVPLQERSYSDYGFRELLSQEQVKVLRQVFWSEPTDVVRTDRKIPSNFQEVQEGIGLTQRGGMGQFGSPPLGRGEYSFWDGRYGDLIADPLVQLGIDTRYAYWTENNVFFPMQVDLHGAIQPVEHLTAMVTAALRGRSSGTLDFATQERFPVYPRNAFLMLHEFPYMAYAKAGIFMPSFGTHIDDHTSFTRDYFEMDVSTSDDTVIGGEIGLAPNYPFLSASVFTNSKAKGYGGALNMGWRDLGFSVTAHGMFKRRELVDRGNLEAGGIGWGFNPFFWTDALPITYMGEFSIGRRQREMTGDPMIFYAMMHEVWITIFNGISVRLKADLGNRDIDVDGGFEQRYTAKLDISPIPGVTFMAEVRALKLTGQDDFGADGFFQLHFWY